MAKKSAVKKSVAKRATPVRATRKVVKRVPVKDTGPLEVEKVSRTELVKRINNTRGSLFVSTHINGKGEERTMVCVKQKGSNQLGYIQVYSLEDKGIRNINTRTVISAVIGKKCLKAPNPKPLV